MKKLILILTFCAAACGESNYTPAPLDLAARLPGGDTTNTLLFGSNAFTPPASNATAEHELLFFTGNSYFNQGWVTAPASTQTRDGLGPLFNSRSCAGCHFKDGRGAPPLGDDPTDFNGLLLRIGVQAGQNSAPHPVYGGQIQPTGIQDVLGEATQAVVYHEVEGAYGDGTPYSLLEPEYQLSDFNYGDPGELFISPRVAPHMIGLGLLEAIPVSRLIEIADADDTDEDGISGRIAPIQGQDIMVAQGRFGWKSEQPTVAAQNAGAFVGDMGITSQAHPNQNCTPDQVECLAAIEGGEFEIEPHLLERVNAYASLIAVPARRGWQDPDALRGEAAFNDANCGACHVPRHVTGAHEFDELVDQTIFPYTDMLLHDMGEELSDGRPAAFEGGAQAQEWRTPPLWGIGLFEDVNGHQRLMHDGRARGVAEAILWHGGEAEESRDAFKKLSKEERDDLVAFVESL